MSSRFNPRQCALFGTALALAFAPLAGKALLPDRNGEVLSVVGPAGAADSRGNGSSADRSTPAVGRFAAVDGGAANPAEASAREQRAKDRNVRVSSPKGTREWSASAMSDHGVPVAAERAYRNASRGTARSDPSCQLPWTLLAGVGRVESDHGRYGGSTLGRDGVSHPLIIGVQLNGLGPVAAIRDSDDGKLDKDKVWDRAVGPMQFIPTTWAGAGRDGDGDGIESPNDLDDAALAAAGYLCSGSGSVQGEAGMAAAVLSYNHDDYYVALVMAFERGYRTGSFVMPAPPAPPAPEKSKRHRKDPNKTRKGSADKTGRDNGPRARDEKVRPRKPKPPRHPSNGHTPKPRHDKPSPKPPKPPSPPKPTPKPPKPTPTGPQLVALSGAFAACGSGWCLGATALDLGPSSRLSARSAADFDGDGSTETNAEEFAGLSGTHVTLQAENKGGAVVVYTINGADFRYADGGFA